MLIVETDKDYYKNIEKRFNKVCPSVGIYHITTDYKKTEKRSLNIPTCIFGMKINWDEYFELIQRLKTYSRVVLIKNYSLPKEEKENNKAYIGKWILDMLWNAQINDNVREI